MGFNQALVQIIDVTGDEPKYIKGYIPEKSVVIPGSEPKILKFRNL